MSEGNLGVSPKGRRDRLLRSRRGCRPRRWCRWCRFPWGCRGLWPISLLSDNAPPVREHW